MGPDPGTVDADLPLIDPGAPGAIPLFMPYVTPSMKRAVAEQLDTRWVGQGPKVDEFEQVFTDEILGGLAEGVAVSSCTAALHLAYSAALGLDGTERHSPGEVIAPVFTCTATNLPLLYLGQKIRWADVDPKSLNVAPESIRAQINDQTRAIVVVHYGGIPARMDEITEIAAERGIPVIEDAAQALGGMFRGRPVGTLGDFGAFSFQAIKHVTTGDGGMLTTHHNERVPELKRRRWFGIDRHGKQSGTWENDISELGFKYQMTDIAASMGVAALESISSVLGHRKALIERYAVNLAGLDGVRVLVGNDRDPETTNAAWLATLVVREDCSSLRDSLRAEGIEANPVHFRNDRYSVFEGHASGECPQMDSLEGKYLCVPLHMGVALDDVDRICESIAGWHG